MTSGVVIILGPAGQNLGSGMTGGLVYTLRGSLSGANYNREFVRCEAVDDKTQEWLVDEQEEVWLRRVLSEHVRLTGSPRAQRLLKADAQLPLVRLEPVHLPCSIAETWAPILSRLEQQEISDARRPGHSSAPIVDPMRDAVRTPVRPPAHDSHSIAKPAC